MTIYNYSDQRGTNRDYLLGKVYRFIADRCGCKARWRCRTVIHRWWGYTTSSAWRAICSVWCPAGNGSAYTLNSCSCGGRCHGDTVCACPVTHTFIYIHQFNSYSPGKSDAASRISFSFCSQAVYPHPTDQNPSYFKRQPHHVFHWHDIFLYNHN